MEQPLPGEGSKMPMVSAARKSPAVRDGSPSVDDERLTTDGADDGPASPSRISPKSGMARSLFAARGATPRTGVVPFSGAEFFERPPPASVKSFGNLIDKKPDKTGGKDLLSPGRRSAPVQPIIGWRATMKRSIDLLLVGQRRLLLGDVGKISPRGLILVEGNVGLPLLGNVALFVNRFDRAFRHARFTIDAFIRMDVKHRRPFIEAFNRANDDTVGVSAIVARLSYNVRHGALLWCFGVAQDGRETETANSNTNENRPGDSQGGASIRGLS
jgi:hypothetical protein